MSCYTTEFYVGSNFQRVTAQIDTGSSDFWINDGTSSACNDPGNQCGLYGTYIPELSTSSLPLEDSSFTVSYSDNSGASGSFVTDTILVSEKTLPAVQVGVAYSSASALGVIGLGFSGGEQGVWQNGAAAYPTFPEVLLRNHLINLNAYSLWLNDLTASTGSVLYGGVDTAKYDGKLSSLPILPPNTDENEHQELWITLNAAIYDGIRSASARVLLDSGAQFTYLPLDYAQSVFHALNAQLSDTGRPYVECDLANSAKTIDFEFGESHAPITIRIPMAQFVYHDIDKVPLKNPAGDDLCILALSFDADSNLLLGASFLRSAYVVFDVTHEEISLAQAKFTSDTNVVEIPKGGIPGSSL